MPSATLDVNVLVSAVIMGHGIPFQLVEAWRARRFTVVTSEHIIAQLSAKLRTDRIGRRYAITPADIRAITTLLRRDARIVSLPVEEVVPITGDPEDDAVL